MPNNYRWDTARDHDPAGYEEKPALASGEKTSTAVVKWRDAKTDPPPRLQEVLATDEKNVKEAWLSHDLTWMRINATWERVFGTQVKYWAAKPAAPGRAT